MAQMVNVNFKMDADVKKKMESVCAAMGLSMSAAFTIFAKKVGSECIFRPSESKETVGVSPPSREKQVQVHGRESTGVLFGKKWQRNASQSAPPRVIYSDWNPFLLRMESSPSMRIL